MADPLSIIASALAVTEALFKTTKCIRSITKTFKGATAEIDALEQDIKDFQYTLIQARQSVAIFDSDVHVERIDRANARLEELKDLLSSFASATRSSVSKRTKWVSIQSDAFRIRQDIRNICQLLHGTLATHSLAKVFRAGQDHQSINAEKLDSIIALLSHHQDTDLVTPPSHLASNLLHHDDSSLSHSCTGSDFFTSSNSSGVSYEEIRPKTLDSSTCSQNYVSGGVSIQSVPSSAVASQVLPVSASTLQQLEPQTRFCNDMGFGLSAAVKFGCGGYSAGCGCRCHIRTKSELLSGWGAYFGLLNVESSGISWNSTCDQIACKRRGKPLLKVKYYLPKWLFDPRMFAFNFSRTSLGDPVCALKIRRLRPMDALVFRFVRDDNVEGLKQLFEKGEATPDDIQGVGREVMFAGNCSPILTSAVCMGNVRVTNFLLNSEVDVQLEDGDGK